MPTMGRMGVFGGMALGSAGFVPRRVGAPYFRAQAQATAFALLGDRYHNSDHYRTAFGRTLVEGAGLSIDFSDDYTLVNADHLSRYRMLIIARDGINWPYGHGNPTSNAGWWAQGQHEIVSDPPLPEIEARSVGWITPEQGQAVKEFVENGGTARFYHNVTNVACTATTSATLSGLPTRDTRRPARSRFASSTRTTRSRKVSATSLSRAPHLGAVEPRVREGPEERCARAPGGGLSPAGGVPGPSCGDARVILDKGSATDQCSCTTDVRVASWAVLHRVTEA